MIFNSRHLQAFRSASGDENPLHHDADYAGRTPFGRPIVYGVAAVIQSLAEWSDGKPFRLLALKAQFLRPLFWDEPYTLDLKQTGDRVEARVLKNGFLQTKISWAPAPFDGGMETQERSELARVFGLKSSQLPAAQLSALLWASRFVGMEQPGKQALFAELDFKFQPQGDSEFSPLELTTTFDDRFMQLQIEGVGPGVEHLRLTAYRRPEPIDHDLAAIRKIVGAEQVYLGKKIFVSGGSRGLGAALSKAFALAGAQVTVNTRAPVDANQWPPGTCFAVGDLLSDQDCLRFARESEAPPDILVLNAFPPITNQPFLEQTPEEFLAFVTRSIAMQTGVLHAFLRSAAPKLVVNISSIFSQLPQAQFTHYIAAKSALEGLMRGLAAEMPRSTFLTIRPSRILTDQTNVIQKMHDLPSAPVVADAILKLILKPLAGKNIHELNL